MPSGTCALCKTGSDDLPRGLRHPTAAPLWTLLIVGLCSIPGTELPDVPVLQFDKLVHLSLFVVFAVLWLIRRPPVGLGFVAFFGVALAIVTEPYQGWLSLGRVPDPLDAVANLVGLAIGIALGARLRRRRLETRVPQRHEAS